MKDYSKAYVELNGMISEFSSELFDKIPEELLSNIKENMSKDYIWEYDKSKNPEDQDLMPETKALFIQIYEKYICPEEEKSRWEEYNQMCFNIAEGNKRKIYNPDNIFKSEENNNDVNKKEEAKDTSMVVYEENFLQKILNKFKSIVCKIFKKTDK